MNDKELKKLKAHEPRNSPSYIEANCENCSALLVLYDLLYEKLNDPEENTGDSVWYDEWICPSCKDGIYMDWYHKDCKKFKIR